MSGRNKCHSLLLGHTAPRDDELLSSWLVRLAAQNRMKLHSFCKMLWPGAAIWNRDIDNSVTPELLGVLAERTGVDLKRASETALKSYEGFIFEKHNPNGTTIWILPLGIYHRTRLRFGLHYCPDCLDQGMVYYRKIWRLAWSVMCVEHNRPLLDRCRCGSPIVFHRGDLGDSQSVGTELGLTKCHHCNADLRRLQGGACDISLTCAALETQRTCMAALRDGYITVAAERIESVLFFAGFRQLLQILAHGRLAVQLRDAGAPWRRSLPDVSFTSGRNSNVERLAVEDRTVLMALAGEWLCDWPGSFVTSCKKAGLTATDICRNMRYVPYWLAKVVDEHFGSGTYSPCIDEIASAISYLRNRQEPTTKTSVSKMLGRTDVFRKRHSTFYWMSHKTTFHQQSKLKVGDAIWTQYCRFMPNQSPMKY